MVQKVTSLGRQHVVVFVGLIVTLVIDPLVAEVARHRSLIVTVVLTCVVCLERHGSVSPVVVMMLCVVTIVVIAVVVLYMGLGVHGRVVVMMLLLITVVLAVMWRLALHFNLAVVFVVVHAYRSMVVVRGVGVLVVVAGKRFAGGTPGALAGEGE